MSLKDDLGRIRAKKFGFDDHAVRIQDVTAGLGAGDRFRMKWSFGWDSRTLIGGRIQPRVGALRAGGLRFP